MNSTKIIGLILGPLLFALLWQLGQTGQSGQFGQFGLEPKIAATLATACWMIVWWITEAVPVPATALLPIILFPLTSVFSIQEATSIYGHPVIFLFLGGFIISRAFEKHQLHHKVALALVRASGGGPKGIILAFLVATALLSMWVSNTATAVMMLPVALSIIEQLGGRQGGRSRFALALLLTIAYSANIGGMATLIGSPPNLILAGQIRELASIELDFAAWLKIGLPCSLLLLAIAYFYITRYILGKEEGKWGARQQEQIGLLLQQNRTAGSRLSSSEKRVLAIFAATALFWIFKSPINQLTGLALNDSIIAIVGGLAMFALPGNLKKGEPILTWADTQKLPWGILLLFGGGLCLAKAMEISGLLAIISQFLASLNMPPSLFLILATGIALFATELMSNTALTSILVPILIAFALSIQVSPLYLALPATLAASCAFMMPISTPPNAVVFSSGHLSMPDMIRAGILMNLLSLISLSLMSHLLYRLVY